MMMAPPKTMTVTPIMTRPMVRLMAKDMMTPKAHMAGTGRIIWRDQMKACWTTLTSLSVRVIMEPVPMRSKSLVEKVREWSYKALRRSRPRRADRRTQK